MPGGDTSKRAGLAAALVALLMGCAACSAEPERDGFGAVIAGGEATVHDLQVGDCLSGTSDAITMTVVRIVPCNEEH